MKVHYWDIHALIMTAVSKARNEGRVIRYIELNEEEWQELCRLINFKKDVRGWGQGHPDWPTCEGIRVIRSTNLSQGGFR